MKKFIVLLIAVFILSGMSFFNTFGQEKDANAADKTATMESSHAGEHQPESARKHNKKKHHKKSTRKKHKKHKKTSKKKHKKHERSKRK